MAFSMSTVLVSAKTAIATAAATSEGLNSKKSIPALISHQPKTSNSLSNPYHICGTGQREIIAKIRCNTIYVPKKRIEEERKKDKSHL